MIAVEQQLIHGRSNLVLRRFDQPETKIARRIFDSIKIARELPLRCRYINCAGVSKLIRLFVEVVTKTNGIS